MTLHVCLFLLIGEAWLLGAGLAKSESFQREIEFEPVPESSEYFMQSPGAVAWDPERGLLVLDNQAQVLFHYDAKGRFLKTIGRPGQGPGEFQFSFFRPGLIALIDDEIQVFNGSRGGVERFTWQGKSLNRAAEGRSQKLTMYFHPLPQGQTIFLEVAYNAKDENSRILRIQTPNAKNDQDLLNVPDNGWYHEDGKMIFKAFQSNLIAAYSPSSQQLIYGDGAKPVIQIWDVANKTTRTLPFKMVQETVTQGDREEYLSQPIFENPMVEAVFAEDKPFYNKLFHLGANRFLIVLEAPTSGKIRATLLDKDQTSQQLTARLGELGRVLGNNDAVFQFQLDDEEAFRIQKIKLKNN